MFKSNCGYSEACSVPFLKYLRIEEVVFCGDALVGFLFVCL